MASKTIAYPSVTNPAYKGAVSEIRTALNTLQRRINSSPDLLDEALAQITAFVTHNS